MAQQRNGRKPIVVNVKMASISNELQMKFHCGTLNKGMSKLYARYINIRANSSIYTYTHTYIHSHRHSHTVIRTHEQGQHLNSYHTPKWQPSLPSEVFFLMWQNDGKTVCGIGKMERICKYA